MTAARSTRLPAVGLLAVLVAAGAVAWWVFLGTAEPPPAVPAASEDPSVAADPPPPDPRLTFSTVFRNVRPEVAYVGDAACAGCHHAVAESYRTHPMGRSAAWVGGGSGPVERYDAAAHNPCRVGPHELVVDRGKDRVVHRVRAAGDEYAVAADLAIGSGTRGRYRSGFPPGRWSSGT